MAVTPVSSGFERQALSDMKAGNDLVRVSVAALCLVGVTSLSAGCASAERLAFEALQQRECVTSTGVACPQQSGGYDAYRAQRAGTLQPADAGG